MVTPMILAQVAKPQTISARIVSISDGDTLTIRSDSGQNIIIKLVCIDAPERNQPGGKEAAQRLSTLLPKGVKVTFGSFGYKDQYGRTPGILVSESLFINMQLIREGQAWIYEKENSSCQPSEQVRRLQANAQKQRLGLWNQANPCPPWDYRSNKCGAIRTHPPKKRTSNDDTSINGYVGNRYFPI